MTTEEQRMLTLMKALGRELVVYYSFAQFLKQIVGATEVERMIASARHDTVLQTQIDSYLEDFCAGLPQMRDIDPDQALQAFLSQWTQQGKPN
jgi:hypothetical protein